MSSRTGWGSTRGPRAFRYGISLAHGRFRASGRDTVWPLVRRVGPAGAQWKRRCAGSPSPDPFFREWIQSHYTTSLLEAAEAVLGRPMQLSIRIHNELEPPLGDVVEQDPPASIPESNPHHRTSVIIPLPTKPNMPFPFPPPIPDLPDSSLPPPSDRPQPPGACSRQIQARFHPHLDPSAASRDVLKTSSPVQEIDLLTPQPVRWLIQPVLSFNPLVIHGAIGLGKTHLLEGITHILRKSHPNLNIAQLTAEAFTNSFLEAMRTGSLSNFRSRYRSAGGLIVDDVHFLAAKRATQDEFLHTFNALIDKGAPIVLAADQHPRLISRLTDELVTRFLGGMVVKIEQPDLATRRAI